MTAENDLALAYHMGYDDALAKRKPDASKAQVLAPYDLEADNAKLRELVRNLLRVLPRDVSGVVIGAHGEHPTYYSFTDAMRDLGVEVDE